MGLGLCSSHCPWAIVCGRGDQYGAPLGSNITSKVALAKGGVGQSEAGVAQGGLLQEEDSIVGRAGPAYQWVPALGSPWALGHRKLPLEVGEDG